MNEQNEREKRAEENRRESDEALRLAKEQQEADIRNGVKQPIISVAESIAEKLKGKYGADGKVGEQNPGSETPQP